MDAAAMAAIARVQLRPPRDPSKAVLYPNADRRAMEDEISMMWEDMATQAETMVAYMACLDDDGGSEVSSVAASGEP
jgi:hypothetical protein